MCPYDILKSVHIRVHVSIHPDVFPYDILKCVPLRVYVSIHPYVCPHDILKCVLVVYMCPSAVRQV